MSRHIFRIFALAAAVIVTAPAQAASVADFYKNRTVTVQVPSGSGGTYHVYCQVVTQLIGQYIPGKPKVIIQNMPGAGGAKSASFMAVAAPKDGTILAMIAPGTITLPLVRKVKFDARKFNWLGAVAARPNGVFAWHTHKVTTIEDLKKKEFLIATTGLGSAGSVIPMLINATLGTKMKLISGYKGGGALNVAIERGEAQGRWNFYSGFMGVRPTWLPQKKIIPIISTGPVHPDFKHVPHLKDMLKAGTMERRMYDVLATNLEVGQGFYLPPGVPQDRVKALRTAFAKMIASDEIKKVIKKRRIEYSPRTAAEVEAAIAAGFKAATPDVVERIKGLYKKKKS